MATKVHGYDEIKFFKITWFNMHTKVKNWYKELNLASIDWDEMKTCMQQKFGDVDLDELIMKMDAIK